MGRRSGMKKATKVTIEYEDGKKDIIDGEAAVLFQIRVNTSGILAGIEVKTEE